MPELSFYRYFKLANWVKEVHHDYAGFLFADISSLTEMMEIIDLKQSHQSIDKENISHPDWAYRKDRLKIGAFTKDMIGSISKDIGCSSDNVIEKLSQHYGDVQLAFSKEDAHLLGRLIQEAYGKECRMRTNEKGREAFEKARPYLINPVQQTVTIKSQNQYETCPLSGESALAKQTMLGVPKIPTRAVFKDKVDIGEVQDIDIRWDTDDDVIRLELWKYNPRLFSDNDIVNYHIYFHLLSLLGNNIIEYI